VEAILASGCRSRSAVLATPPGAEVGRIEGKVVWVLELFERLERRDRARWAPLAGEKIAA
jgi:hypothetical protein